MAGLEKIISMNLNDQCTRRRCLYKVKAHEGRQNGLPFSPRHRTTIVALVKATKNKANLATDEVHMENRNHGLA